MIQTTEKSPRRPRRARALLADAQGPARGDRGAATPTRSFQGRCAQRHSSQRAGRRGQVEGPELPGAQDRWNLPPSLVLAFPGLELSQHSCDARRPASARPCWPVPFSLPRDRRLSLRLWPRQGPGDAGGAVSGARSGSEGTVAAGGLAQRRKRHERRSGARPRQQPLDSAKRAGEHLKGHEFQAIKLLGIYHPNWNDDFFSPSLLWRGSVVKWKEQGAGSRRPGFKS